MDVGRNARTRVILGKIERRTVRRGLGRFIESGAGEAQCSFEPRAFSEDDDGPLGLCHGRGDPGQQIFGVNDQPERSGGFHRSLRRPLDRETKFHRRGLLYFGRSNGKGNRLNLPAIASEVCCDLEILGQGRRNPTRELIKGGTHSHCLCLGGRNLELQRCCSSADHSYGVSFSGTSNNGLLRLETGPCGAAQKKAKQFHAFVHRRAAAICQPATELRCPDLQRKSSPVRITPSRSSSNGSKQTFRPSISMQARRPL